MPELTRSRFPGLPTGCHDRLVAHYGPGVLDWLSSVPETLEHAARRWGLTPTTYHDAGHASVLVLATSPEGERVLLKAWPDGDRCSHETAALRHWSDVPAARVLAIDERRSVAALSLIGERPGGGQRSSDDARRVAEVVRTAHSRGCAVGEGQGFLELSLYLDGEVRPRVARRVATLDLTGFRRLLRTGLRELASLRQARHRQTLLHGDLYQENTVCDEDGRPHLIDPLPMLGDAVFDWAFWTVYYALGRGTDERLGLAARMSGIEREELRSWCLAMCLDGLLYYLDVGDARVEVMTQVMARLSQLEEAVR